MNRYFNYGLIILGSGIGGSMLYKIGRDLIDKNLNGNTYFYNYKNLNEFNNPGLYLGLSFGIIKSLIKDNFLNFFVNNCKKITDKK
jgi:hypothetical protein